MKHAESEGTLFTVEDPLKEVINNCYHLYVPQNGVPVTRHVCPNLEMMLVFNFGVPPHISFHNAPPVTDVIDRMAVIGPLRKMLNYELQPGSDILIVNFKFNGFQRLFDMPLSGLNHYDVTHADLLLELPYFDSIQQALAVLPNAQKRVASFLGIAQYLLKENDRVIHNIIGNLSKFFDPHVDPVKAIAFDVRLSQRSIQLKFQKHTGYSVKELLRFLRFKEVVASVLSLEGQKIDVFDLVVRYDYHDQSHLIKDFQYFLGAAPMQFISNLHNGSFCVISDTYQL